MEEEKEIERLLKELKASKNETAVTVEEVEDRPADFGVSGKWFFQYGKSRSSQLRF